MRTNEKRKQERARRKFQFEHLRLQADILCDSHKEEARQTVILNRMMLIILDIIGDRGLNDAKREALADHFTDCASTRSTSVELGGTGDRDSLYLDGAFRVSDLAKRIAWSEARTGQTIEVDHARYKA
jgi:hypothetical protein